MLVVIMFIAAFVMLVTAIIFYQKAEDAGQVAALSIANETKADLKNYVKRPDFEKEMTAHRASVDEEIQALRQLLDKRETEMNELNQKLSALPRPLNMRIDHPIQVEVLRREKTVPPQKTTGRGANSLINRAGISKEKRPEVTQ